VRGDDVFAILKVSGAPARHEAEAIVTWCLDQLAYYKAPGYVHFVDALPLTATQKIQRNALKTLAAELVAHPKTYDTRHLKKRGGG
jgi:acyl-coenzyme A synthetase/AMP-(fatty) acid ligase